MVAMFAHMTIRAGPRERGRGFPSAETSPVLFPSPAPYFALLPAGAVR